MVFLKIKMWIDDVHTYYRNPILMLYIHVGSMFVMSSCVKDLMMLTVKRD
jgi:hypothetical protein